MKHVVALFSLLAALPTALALAFIGPAPTATSPKRELGDKNPEPTNAPSINELKKRQTNDSPETCGWIDGDYSSGITCNTGYTCMLYTSASFGMAGCCDGLETQDCGWSNTCIDYENYNAGNCDTNCQLNSFVRRCTDSARPYCVTWSYPADNVLDYGCASTSSDTIYTIIQRGTDADGDTTSMALPTVTGDAVTGYDETISDSATDAFFTSETGTDTAYPSLTTDTFLISDATESTSDPTDFPSSSSGGGSTRKSKKKVAVGVIIGIVVAVLFLVFCVVVGIVFLLKKKKKQRQLAANNQAIAAAQANRPQSTYPPPQQQQPQMQMQQHQQGGFAPQPMSPQSPPAPFSGYFPPSGPADQKYNPHTSVHEYGSPVSSPNTPAPAYSQPYGSPAAAPMPMKNNVHAHYGSPSGGPLHEADSISVAQPAAQQGGDQGGQYPMPGSGAHEVDAISTPQAPASGRPVYEMGQGR